jgi:hypothetical protein
MIGHDRTDRPHLTLVHPVTPPAPGCEECLTAVVGDPGEILTLSMDQLRDLVTRESNLGDVVLRACLGRRALLVG